MHGRYVHCAQNLRTTVNYHSSRFSDVDYCHILISIVLRRTSACMYLHQLEKPMHVMSLLAAIYRELVTRVVHPSPHPNTKMKRALVV